jgi:hypothetical protein
VWESVEEEYTEEQLDALDARSPRELSDRLLVLQKLFTDVGLSDRLL